MQRAFCKEPLRRRPRTRCSWPTVSPERRWHFWRRCSSPAASSASRWLSRAARSRLSVSTSESASVAYFIVLQLVSLGLVDLFTKTDWHATCMDQRPRWLTARKANDWATCSNDDSPDWPESPAAPTRRWAAMGCAGSRPERRPSFEAIGAEHRDARGLTSPTAKLPTNLRGSANRRSVRRPVENNNILVATPIASP
jgi:hypothetical protein